MRGVCAPNLGGIRALMAWEKIPKVMVLGGFLLFKFYYLLLLFLRFCRGWMELVSFFNQDKFVCRFFYL
jgi:hypothetical protein